jgi:hypothetical protein
MKTFGYILCLIGLLGAIVSNGQEVQSKKDTSAAIPRQYKVFLKTDKQIYAPGETVMFNARVFDCANEKPVPSEDLQLMVRGNKGDIITDQKFKVTNGVVDGEISIPNWANEGIAYLVAFTPQALLNSQANMSGIQPIAINSLRKNDYGLTIEPEKAMYNPGEELSLSVNLVPITAPVNKKEKVSFVIGDFNGPIIDEVITLQTGLNKLKYKIPLQFDRGLYIEITGQDKHFIYQKLPIHTTADVIQLEFFPESGHLLSNTIQKIVYRVTDPFGEPISVTGKIYDEGNHFVGVGKTLKPGYGLISLMPMPDQKYTFIIDSEYGNGAKFNLPETIIDGVVFIYLKNENGTIRNILRTSGKYVGQELTITASTSGKTCFQHTLTAKEEMRVDFPAILLSPGIVQLSVSDSKGDILSERLIYYIEPLSEGLEYLPQISTTPPDQKMDLTINAETFVRIFPNAVFDVKIVDKFSLFDRYDPIPNSFLRFPLTESFPATVLDIYLANVELIANEHLGMSAMNKNKKILEQTGKVITGKVINKEGKPVPGVTVMASHPDYPTLWKAESDVNGDFIIEGVAKTAGIKVKAIDKSGKKTYNVKLNHSFDESLDEMIWNYSFRIKSIYNPQKAMAYYNRNKDLLKSYQQENRLKQNNRGQDIERMLHSGSSILDVIKMMKPFHLENNQIVFYGSENSLNFQSGALIVIDGQKMGTDIDALSILSPADVKSINVSTNPMDIQKYTGLNSVGVIEIWTRSKLPDNKTTETEDEGLNGKSQQTTLLWLPGIKSDGPMVYLKFMPNLLYTDFIIQVDAVSENGQEVSNSTFFANAPFLAPK